MAILLKYEPSNEGLEHFESPFGSATGQLVFLVSAAPKQRAGGLSAQPGGATASYQSLKAAGACKGGQGDLISLKTIFKCTGMHRDCQHREALEMRSFDVPGVRTFTEHFLILECPLPRPLPDSAFPIHFWPVSTGRKIPQKHGLRS